MRGADPDTAAIDGGGIDHRKARHAPSIGVGAKATARESADQPGGNDDQGQYGHECENKGHCLHALSPAGPLLSSLSSFPRSTQAAKRRLKPEPTLNIPRQKLPRITP